MRLLHSGDPERGRLWREVVQTASSAKWIALAANDRRPAARHSVLK